jgi:hypothetical protein
VDNYPFGRGRGCRAVDKSMVTNVYPQTGVENGLR